ncbi:FtsB family cell division protein [Kineococcus xinjiangensis]|uniref:FtsB family cell division protein n=1 Tax=Kineococcus xinjiangensis TaxID=512762 RepID=UPI001304A26F|nr:septum formation initiator family protein [Kineococcus xinjiangensis]
MLLSLLVVLAVFLVPSLQKWLQQRSQIAELRAGIVAQEQQLALSRAEELRWDDPAYVQAQARARLQYVVPGEDHYVIDGPSSADEVDPAETAATVPRPEEAWYANVWESLRVAGLAPQDELTGSVPAPSARPAPATTGAP